MKNCHRSKEKLHNCNLKTAMTMFWLNVGSIWLASTSTVAAAASCQGSQLRVTIWTDCLPRSRQSASQTIKLTNQTTTHLMHFNQSTWGRFKTSTAVKHSLYRYRVIFMLSTYEKDLHSRKKYDWNKLEKALSRFWYASKTCLYCQFSIWP